MKKIYEIGTKTGLTANELHKIGNTCVGAATKAYGHQAARFGLFGLLAAALTALTGCCKICKPASQPSKSAPRASAQTGPGTIQDLVNSIDKSTGTAKPKAGDDCGPYPGYPCGTKYYTVSVSDFKKTA